jgi:hypothetical protein
MHATSHLRALPLALLVAVAAPACAGEMDEPGAVQVASGPNAPFCGAEAPMGRLCGRVYALPLETRRLPDFGALEPFETLLADRLAVGERRGYPGFPGVPGRFEWFGIDFQGGFTVRAPGVLRLRLTSDDGSRLYIDDVLVIDNDGYHPVRTMEATVGLAAGEHRVRVPFWQGPGPFALTLEVARPGEGYRILRFDRPL